MTADLQQITEETVAAIAKAQTAGILESTGAYSYDLTGVVNLIPRETPFRDSCPRTKSTSGSPFAIWRAFMNLTNSQPDPSPGFDYAGNEVLFQEQDFQAKYQPLALAGLVTQDAFDLAQGLFDPYANATMQVLNQVLIGEERKLLGGQSFALPTPGSITTATATTGGSIPATTAVHIGVAARTGAGYYYGGNSIGAAATVTTGSGSTNTVAGSIPAVKGALAYDWFQSPDGTAWHYYTTTTVASVTMTAVITGNQPVPVTALPNISAAVPAYSSTVDHSAQAASIDGLVASLTGDYNAQGQFVTAGSSTSNGAVFLDGGGQALTLSGGNIAQVSEVFASIWNQVYCSPTELLMNSATSEEVSNLILSSPSAVTYLQTEAAGRTDVVAGGRVGSLINTPAGGTVVPIKVQTNLPPGCILFRTDRVPFPQANISSVLEVRTLRDMAQYDYATNRASGSGGGPRKEFEIRSVEAFINRAPVAMGALVNIA